MITRKYVLVLINEIKRWTIFPILLLLALSAGCEVKYGYYGTWDADRDNIIVEDEFNAAFTKAGYFQKWDLDGDGIIAEPEWEKGIITYLPNYNVDIHGTYEDWSQNGNEGVYEEDFRQRNYELWDSNNDGEIDETEYQDWYYEAE